MQQQVPDDFIICSGFSSSIREVVELVFSILGIPANALVTEKSLYRPAEISENYGNPEKASQLLKWRYDWPLHQLVEKLIEDANVDMTNYGVLTSTDSKRILKSNPAFAGGSDSVWEKLRNPISSPEITDDRCFAGCWNNLTFCLWGRGVERLIDQVTAALSGQVKIYASLLCDVGVRYPSAFAVTATVAGP